MERFFSIFFILASACYSSDSASAEIGHGAPCDDIPANNFSMFQKCVDSWEKKTGDDYYETFKTNTFGILNNAMGKHNDGLSSYNNVGSTCISINEFTRILEGVLASYGFKKPRDVAQSKNNFAEGTYQGQLLSNNLTNENRLKTPTDKERWDTYENRERNLRTGLIGPPGFSKIFNERIKEEKKLCFEHNECPW